MYKTKYKIEKKQPGFIPLETARARPVRDSRASRGRNLRFLISNGARSAPLSLTGFTIVEILIVVGVISSLAAILLLYGRGGENQLILFKEQSKLVSMVYRAKSLSIETFSDPNSPCGYGIHFDPPAQYFIFRDMPPPAGCVASDKRYSDAGIIDEIVESYTLNPRVSLDMGTPKLTDILFIPPDPKTVFQPVGVADPAVITLKTSTGNSLDFSINSVGQISL